MFTFTCNEQKIVNFGILIIDILKEKRKKPGRVNNFEFNWSVKIPSKCNEISK